MKFNFYKIFSSLIFLFFSQYALSDEYVTCNKCTNFTFAAKKAITTEVPGSYFIHVADFETEILKTYSIKVIRIGFEPGSGVPLYAKLATSVKSPTAIKSEFSQIIQIKLEIINAASTSQIPPDIANTGWDLYGDSARQDTFLQYFYQNPTLIQGVTALANTLGNWIKINFPITVTLESGATIVLTYSRTEIGPNGELLAIFEIDFSKSKDKNKNPLVIPSATSNNGADVQYEFDNGTQTLTVFLAAATRSGFSTGSSGTGGLLVICTYSKGKITCFYTKKN